MCSSELLVKAYFIGNVSFFEHFFFCRFLFLSVFYFLLFFFIICVFADTSNRFPRKHTFVHRNFRMHANMRSTMQFCNCSQTVRELFIRSDVDTIFLLFANSLRTASTIFDLVNRIFDVSFPERTYNRYNNLPFANHIVKTNGTFMTWTIFTRPLHLSRVNSLENWQPFINFI